jgi:hypothetical protein
MALFKIEVGRWRITTARWGASVLDCLSMRPDFSIAQFTRKEPFKIATDAEQVASSLRLAGLPE